MLIKGAKADPKARSHSPDPSGIGPVTGHPRGQQQWGHRLIKQEVVINQLLLLLLCHVLEGIVLSFKIAIKGSQSCEKSQDTSQQTCSITEWMLESLKFPPTPLE